MDKKLLLIGAVSGLVLMTTSVNAETIKRECEFTKFPQYPLSQSCDTTNDGGGDRNGPYSS